jgi:hypothetical protein
MARKWACPEFASTDSELVKHGESSRGRHGRLGGRRRRLLAGRRRKRLFGRRRGLIALSNGRRLGGSRRRLACTNPEAGGVDAGNCVCAELGSLQPALQQVVPCRVRYNWLAVDVHRCCVPSACCCCSSYTLVDHSLLGLTRFDCFLSLAWGGGDTEDFQPVGT